MGGGKLEARQNLYSTAPRIVFTLRKICRLAARLAGANPKLKFSLVDSSKIYSPRRIQLEVNAYSTPPPMFQPFNHLFWGKLNVLGAKHVVQAPVIDSFVFANSSRRRYTAAYSAEPRSPRDHEVGLHPCRGIYRTK